MNVLVLFPVALLSFAAVFVSSGADARDVSMPERFNVGGYTAVSRTAPHVLAPHASPRPLLPAAADDPDRRGNRSAVEAARAYLRQYPATTGLMLIDRGRVVFEGYQGKGSDTSEFYSQSLAKSMTSLAVGKALCNRVIDSLDTPAGRYVPELRINNYGKATIRQLLAMSSGAYMTKRAGQPQVEGGIGRRPRNGKPFYSTPWPTRLGQMTHAGMMWGAIWRRTQFRDHAVPGEVFVYKAGDTLALGLVVERLTGASLAAYFDRTVWQAVRGAAAGRWEADSTGSTMAYAGLQFRLRDWGRIAVWVLEQRERAGCFGDYLRDATTTRIANARLGSRAGSSFDGYGYQWWTDNPDTPGFWGLGYAGQAMGLNPATGKILIKFGYKANGRSVRRLSSLFRTWNQTHR